jgi:hypothetical protein
MAKARRRSWVTTSFEDVQAVARRSRAA